MLAWSQQAQSARAASGVTSEFEEGGTFGGFCPDCVVNNVHAWVTEAGSARLDSRERCVCLDPFQHFLHCPHIPCAPGILEL